MMSVRAEFFFVDVYLVFSGVLYSLSTVFLLLYCTGESGFEFPPVPLLCSAVCVCPPLVTEIATARVGKKKPDEIWRHASGV